MPQPCLCQACVGNKLCRQIAKLYNRLSKIECVISKIDEIDKTITKVLHIEKNVPGTKELLNFMDTGFFSIKKQDTELKFQNNFFRSLYKNMNFNFITCTCRCHRIKENLKPFGGSSQETMML